jgi:hypothetical protein
MSLPERRPVAWWPLQDLDLFDVEQFLVELRGVDHQHAVHQYRYRHFRIAVLRDAACGDEGVAGILGLHQRDIGRERDEVGRIFYAGGLDLLFGEYRHGYRHIHVGFVALAGSDNDFLDCGLRHNDGGSGDDCTGKGTASEWTYHDFSTSCVIMVSS